MFKVKNTQLNTESIQCLNSLIEEDINAAAAFKLTRIVKHISSIVEVRVDLEKKILDRWSQKDENGELKLAKDENGNDVQDAILISDMDSFTKEMSDLLNVENEIPFNKLDFEELGLKTAKIKDLLKIEFLFN